MESLSSREARRVALAAQGLPRRTRSPSPSKARILDVARRQGVLQIDSVNILARAHYLPVFSRLGPYQTERLDALAYVDRQLYEAWSHEASLIPVELWPAHGWRRRADGERWRSYMNEERLEYAQRVLKEVEERGPLGAGDLRDPGERRAGSWWNRSAGKTALEFLFGAGAVAVSQRRSFERIYDLTERVIPAEVLASPEPSEHDARRLLVERAARALGVGTVGDLADYFRQKKTPVRRIVDELVGDGALLAVAVEGWPEPGYVTPDVTVPRRIDGGGLLSPFDPIVWYRPRAERLFGFHYRIEIYVPEPKRVYGYYVLPFLLGEGLAARVDLKADRRHRVLRVLGAWREPQVDAQVVASAVARELLLVAEWLSLDSVDVTPKGDLAEPVREALASA